MSDDVTEQPGIISNALGQLGGCLAQIAVVVVISLLCQGDFIVIFAFLIPLAVPLIGALIVGWLFQTLAPERLRPLRRVVAVQGGLLLQYVLALAVAYLYFGEASASLLWEVVAVSAVLAWLVARPAAGAVILLILYNLFSIVVGLMRSQAAEAGAASFSGLLGQLIYGGVAVYFLVRALRAGVGRLRNVTERPKMNVAPREVGKMVAETLSSIRTGVYEGVGLSAPATSSPTSS